MTPDNDKRNHHTPARVNNSARPDLTMLASICRNATELNSREFRLPDGAELVAPIGQLRAGER